jgi:YHS domain-containing protein
MSVDRGKAVTKELGGETYYFCSEHCLHAFEADPRRYIQRDGRPVEQRVAEHAQ